MKILNKYILLFCSLPIFLFGCSDDDPVIDIPDKPQEEHGNKDEEEKEPVKAEIVFKDTLSVFPSKGGSQDIAFTSTDSWKVSSDQTWCSVNPESGNSGSNKLTVKVSFNETYDERNSALIFTSGSIVKKLTVVQKQMDAILLTASKAEVSSEGGEVSVELQANIGYTYEIDKAASRWITETKSRNMASHTHRFTVKGNDDILQREGSIIFRGEACADTFRIYQQGADPKLVLTSKYMQVDWNANDVKIELQSNTDYKMTLPAVDWIHKSSSRGMSTYTHRLSIDANPTEQPRKAEVLFEMEGQPAEKVLIYQLSSLCHVFVRIMGKSYEVPLFTGGENMTGIIYWKHTTEAYQPGLRQDFTYDWNVNPLHSITFRMENMENIHIDDISEIERINLY